MVCRAVEDCPGPVVEQQFGEFPSWTQAHSCATKLNEGLDLDLRAVRQIVTSSILASACVVQEALKSRDSWEGTRVEIETRAAQLRFVLSELALALTFCRTAAGLSGAPVLRVLLQAREALRHSAQFLKSFNGSYQDMEQVAASAETVKVAYEEVTLSTSLGK